MRVAVVYAGGESAAAVAAGISRGIQSRGHDVDIISVQRDRDKKLTPYRYFVIGCEPLSFWSGNIPDDISVYLKQAGMVSGKMCYAFLKKKGLFPLKSLRILMKSIESEGMILKLSDVLKNAQDGEFIGKKLHIE